MKNYCNNDYAVNRYATGIVYRCATGTITVTLDDYLRENPGKTQADFAELKALSDAMYKEEDRAITRQGRKTTVLEEVDATPIRADSPEDTLIRAEDTALRQQWARIALAKMTEVQRRRYLLHVAKGLSTWDIAQMEGVNQSKVFKSIQAAKKKMQNFLDES